VRWYESVFAVVVALLVLVLCAFVKGLSRALHHPVAPNRRGPRKRW